MRELLQYLLLGFIQGATEFLPVSSSGHLVAASKILHVSAPGMVLGICLHFGTLVAILVVLRRELWNLIVDTVRGIRLLLRGRRAAIGIEAPAFRIAVAIVIGSVPAAVVGLCLYDAVEYVHESLKATGALLVVTGIVLLASRFAQQGKEAGVSPLRGFFIGLAQAAALLPGISRSGATIVSAYFLGIDRKLAARFSFLLAVPTLIGAAALEAAKALSAGAGDEALAHGDLLALGCGTATAAIVGAVCLTLLLKVVQKGKLHWFGAYCVPLGILLFVLGSWI